MSATITILDEGAAIKITNGAQVRDIIKSQIREVTVIKTSIIKLDIGGGPLHNVFINYADVLSPATANVDALRAAILTMLFTPAPGVGAGAATEARQIEQTDLLTQINGISGAIRNLIVSIDNKVFYQPLLVDDSGAGVIYKGYAYIGTNMEQSLWAIERVRKEGDINVHTWAN